MRIVVVVAFVLLMVSPLRADQATADLTTAPDRLGTWPDWIMTVVTGAGVIAAWKTIKSIERQSIAAETASTIARAHLRLVQGAHVVLVDIQSVDPHTLEQRTALRVNLKNLGGGRAKDVLLNATLKIGDVSANMTKDKWPIRMADIGAGDTRGVQLPPLGVMFDKDVIERAATAKEKFRVRLSVSYRDVFDEQEEFTARLTFYSLPKPWFTLEDGDGADDH